MFDEMFGIIQFGREVIDSKEKHWLSLRQLKDNFHLCVDKYAEDPCPTFLIAVDEEATKKFHEEKLEELKKQQAEVEKGV